MNIIIYLKKQLEIKLYTKDILLSLSCTSIHTQVYISHDFADVLNYCLLPKDDRLTASLSPETSNPAER